MAELDGAAGVSQICHRAGSNAIFQRATAGLCCFPYFSFLKRQFCFRNIGFEPE